MYVRAGRPAFARPYVGVHRSTSPAVSRMSGTSSLDSFRYRRQLVPSGMLPPGLVQYCSQNFRVIAV